MNVIANYRKLPFCDAAPDTVWTWDKAEEEVRDLEFRLRRAREEAARSREIALKQLRSDMWTDEQLRDAGLL